MTLRALKTTNFIILVIIALLSVCTSTSPGLLSLSSFLDSGSISRNITIGGRNSGTDVKRTNHLHPILSRNKYPRIPHHPPPVDQPIDTIIVAVA